MTTHPTDLTSSEFGAPDLTVGDAPSTPSRSQTDRFMRRLLRLPVDGRSGTASEARKAFQTSIAVATVRCLLMYVFFPFVLPAIGIARGVGPWIGMTISAIAIVAITMSIRRFWRADHSKRWHYTVLGTAVMLFMVYEIAHDIATIAS